jgi:glycosyltransferase involved in cell wall biosynthesis
MGRSEPSIGCMTPPIVLSNHGLRHSGGIERYLLTLVDALHARDLRPIVVAHKFDTNLPEYAWVDPVHIRTWGLGGAWRDRWFDARLRRLKARHGWYPVVALSQTSVADIAICGGTHPGYLAAIGRTPTWKDRLAIALERRHLEHAAVVIAHSALMARQVQAFYGINPSKVEVLYPPVDTQRFRPVVAEQRQQLRVQLGLPHDRCVFLLASTGHARKGLDLLVRALGHSDLPVSLVVAGRPVDVQAPNLRYLGYRSDIEDVYRAVDCTVMASRYEPFGLVGVETVLCGTPLIGAEGMGCMEVLQGDGVLPFNLDAPSGQADSLDQAIAQALARWREGRLTVADPMAALRYDPSPEAHVQALLQWVGKLRATHQERPS